MPYRHSRLQDYYDELLGRKLAEPKEESPPTHSPYLDFVSPPVPPSPPPPKEQSTRRAPSSDSSKEGSVVSSQKDIPPDIGEDEPIGFDSQTSAVEPDVYGNMPLTPGAGNGCGLSPELCNRYFGAGGAHHLEAGWNTAQKSAERLYGAARRMGAGMRNRMRSR